jgi:hypothetical protein
LRQRLGQAAPALLALAHCLFCDAVLVVHRASGLVVLLVPQVEASLQMVVLVLLEEIVRPQHHWSFSLCWLFEELTRCSLFNRIAQPNKLIYSLICLHITRAFKIVHRCGADRTPHCLVLIKHREINDHPIEVVA